VAEPSGAVAFAGYLHRRNELPATRPIVAIVSGGNVEPGLLVEMLASADEH
jgi:threonine dehydratase